MFTGLIIAVGHLPLKILVYSLIFVLAAVVIGFEREIFSVSEPPVGQSLQREMICIRVQDGVVGTPLTIAPSWRPITATGNNFNF